MPRHNSLIVTKLTKFCFLLVYCYIVTRGPESTIEPSNLAMYMESPRPSLTASHFYMCYNYLVLTLMSTVTTGCLRALYMGDNHLTVFPSHIEKFVHLEVVSCMNSTLEHDHTHIYTLLVPSNMITHTCTPPVPSSVITQPLPSSVITHIHGCINSPIRFRQWNVRTTW